MVNIKGIKDALDGLGRTGELKKIGRYSMYKMQYRWNLYEHIQHLQLLLQETLPFLRGYLLNEFLVMAYAAVHDDPELDIRLGDVQTGYKDVMSQFELMQLEEIEERAVDYVIERFGRIDIGSYSYPDILRNYRRQLSPEAQLVHYVDKIAAFYEALHELMAGNEEVITDKFDASGRLTVHPFQGYPKRTQALIANRPFLADLQSLRDVAPFIAPAPGLPYLTLFKQSEPHTLESVRQRSNRPSSGYAAWLKVILNSGNEYLIERLYTPNTKVFANCRT
ncbi:hypothetical protein A3A71_01595 [Candidatus Berkelbacteria bacterium RIFCSPLOWO2_01_FULL_50_28]|uniref:HD domain-containing protein n=1 Tax=Candidatus Berkelbacteria bacterium RIFCSPLOWO2_01_FULL_50_28 TaxID=1797471 RepID=A0A1F5EBE3_9BACT|nr:MAG: hypothetical protein A3F39_03040 [Candidatus Berkelbacteria bacterium RIFCSPHIGHO2_12_FULL_50_11]OGD64728.1 MAG: hypothetical protein A3A71_01595 [Candidatus Berkelbacteria bacterium RIFCSPLOWO2_01_FULL_50_28]